MIHKATNSCKHIPNSTNDLPTYPILKPLSLAQVTRLFSSSVLGPAYILFKPKRNKINLYDDKHINVVANSSPIQTYAHDLTFSIDRETSKARQWWRMQVSNICQFSTTIQVKVLQVSQILQIAYACVCDLTAIEQIELCGRCHWSQALHPNVCHLYARRQFEVP